MSATGYLDHELKIEQGLAKPDRFLAPMSGGVVTSALEATGFNARRATSARENGNDPGFSSLGTQGCQNTFKAKGLENIRVNQDCSLRRQAEEVVVTNPTNRKNLISGQIVSRIGFNHCGYDWSFDGGDTWGDQIPALLPVRRRRRAHVRRLQRSDGDLRLRGQRVRRRCSVRHHLGRERVRRREVQRRDRRGLLPTLRPRGGFQTSRDTPLCRCQRQRPNIAHDKEFIVADSTKSSPKADNVYADLTRFDFDTGA